MRKFIEEESGNDNSPNSLKKQLDSHLGERCTQKLLNEKIDGEEIDIHRHCGYAKPQ